MPEAALSAESWPNSSAARPRIELAAFFRNGRKRDARALPQPMSSPPETQGTQRSSGPAPGGLPGHKIKTGSDNSRSRDLEGDRVKRHNRKSCAAAASARERRSAHRAATVGASN